MLEPAMEGGRQKTPASRLGEPDPSPTEISALGVTQGLGPFRESGTTRPLVAGGTRAAPGSVSFGSQTCSAALGSEPPRGETCAVEGLCGTMSLLPSYRGHNYLVASHSMEGAENGASWDVPGAD
jgi:hypothetical protein